jgi:hypothetical protein
MELGIRAYTPITWNWELGFIPLLHGIGKGKKKKKTKLENLN